MVASAALIRGILVCLLVMVMACAWSAQSAEGVKVNVWPGKAPGEVRELPAEADQWKETDRPVGGRRIIKLGNVSTPTLEIFRPEKSRDTGTAVIICPGGGHSILAYDHEGTEVAEWLNSIGVSGIVLKYRVPARDQQRRYLAAVQDAQRAVSLVRSKASEWGIDAQRIGVLGFSAGGETAGLTGILHDQRLYAAVDEVDAISCRPDFAVLVYPGSLAERDNSKLKDYVKITKETPPMFLAHAFDDGVNVLNSVLLFAELKKAGVASELHTYASGGHGFGMRDTGHAINSWPKRCEEWMKGRGWLEKR